MSEKEKRVREACFFDGILAAAFENMQTTERLIQKHWEDVDTEYLKKAMIYLDTFQAILRKEAKKHER